ncbi:MAG TPA: alpha-1,4-glucan--maltose-1-phosphate maltosyltransferase [Pirellulales bacterium]|nr:alpha-1,4-glucan--maltose-1-phosphate maltosyltransferase [Pirellulales bacterium]
MKNSDLPADGRRRAVIEGVEPAIDAGRFPIKRIVGDRVLVQADVFGDGHDAIGAALLYRQPGSTDWQRVPMRALYNDRWEATFTLDRIGQYRYTVEGWVDHFASWHRDLKKRVEAGQNIAIDLLVGADLVARAAARAVGKDSSMLADWAARLREASPTGSFPLEALEPLAAVMARYPDLEHATRFEPELGVVVDRPRAQFSTWYELFPRSTSQVPGKHGTFADCIARLPYVADMGFDVLYLPPIHPIGQTYRKGRNNALTAAPGEPGSPWAIGAATGGHKAILPELGTLADFERLVDAAARRGMEIALDIAFQCSPDHPYVAEHPEWFRHRPDGTIQYAENPPKKYQDIYPFDFESEDWQGLWLELHSVFVFWIERGVKIFRVDNPHTKAFGFWQWCIGKIKQQYPDVLFLSEAFTRPKLMYRLAKLGFSQSYTYFTWRYGKQEFVDYLTELTCSEVREFFRPNLWPNTPDILPEHLQQGNRAAFMVRYALAATLSSNTGIYGPAYELLEHVPRDPGSEEYLDSEKYEIRTWNLAQAGSLREFITRVNRARHQNLALQTTNNLRFHPVSNDRLLCFSKLATDPHNLVVVVVNLDFENAQQGMIELAHGELGLAGDRPIQLEDLVGPGKFTWQPGSNFVKLDPRLQSAHVFRVTQ